MVDVTVWTIPLPASADLDGIVREILGDALGCDPTQLSITRDCRLCGHPTHGKPRVDGALGFSYNVSHSDGIALVAHTGRDDGLEVGVDVEAVRPRRYLDRLAARILTPPEHEAWSTLPAAERLPAFLRHWTAREAYLKGVGLGLRAPLRDALAGAARWTITDIAGLPGAVGAVASSGGGRVRVVPYAPVP